MSTTTSYSSIRANNGYGRGGVSDVADDRVARGCRRRVEHRRPLRVTSPPDCGVGVTGVRASTPVRQRSLTATVLQEGYADRERFAGQRGCVVGTWCWSELPNSNNVVAGSSFRWIPCQVSRLRPAGRWRRCNGFGSGAARNAPRRVPHGIRHTRELPTVGLLRLFPDWKLPVVVDYSIERRSKREQAERWTPEHRVPRWRPCELSRRKSLTSELNLQHELLIPLEGRNQKRTSRRVCIH